MSWPSTLNPNPCPQQDAEAILEEAQAEYPHLDIAGLMHVGGGLGGSGFRVRAICA